MSGSYARRRWIIAGTLMLILVFGLGTGRYSYGLALTQLAERGEADLSLASDRLSAQLQRYQELAVLTADHPALRGLDRPDQRAAAQRLLLKVADKTSALNIEYVDAQGQVLVSAHGAPGASVMNSQPFRRAMQGALGGGHTINDATGLRLYSYAAPAFGADGKVRGTLIVTLDIADIEQYWPGNTPPVFFIDRAGVVIVSNRSELLFWRKPDRGAGLISPAGAGPFSSHLVGAHEIWQMRWGPYIPPSALHITRDFPVIRLTGEMLIDARPALRLAALQGGVVSAVFLAFGAMLFVATERRRTLAEANAVLETRVAKRTAALSETNSQLRREVLERQEAEAALKRAQADLVQAGKLSALGQMSAGISHELNQPLMAIRSFAENGALYLDRGRVETAGENLTRIAQLSARMARIIKNLRAFVRNESEPMGKVDLVQVVTTAVELTEARLKVDGVDLDWMPGPDPVFAWGGEVRLVQVFVNLINNAADAMSEQDDQLIRIAINAVAPKLTVTVQDIGPGITEPDKVFDPFYSTKTVGSGDGMGLGLSISYGLVQSFGGKIRGENTDRGAMFVVELDRWSEERAA